MIIAGLLVAALMELVGLALAAVGFRRTWTEHAHGEDFWAPVKGATHGAARRMRDVLRAFLRRPPHPVTLQPRSSTIGMSSTSPRLTVGWGPLPDPTDLESFAAVVQERLGDLLARAQDHQHALVDERKAREDADSKIRADLGQEISHVEAGTRRVAVGGLRLQVAGWILVLLGVFLGAIVNVVDRASA